MLFLTLLLGASLLLLLLFVRLRRSRSHHRKEPSDSSVTTTRAHLIPVAGNHSLSSASATHSLLNNSGGSSPMPAPLPQVSRECVKLIAEEEFRIFVSYHKRADPVLMQKMFKLEGGLGL